MTALVACETVLLVLLIVLVAGLLRSHAELLRRLGPAEREESQGDAHGAAAPGRRAAPGPAAAARSPRARVCEIAGVTPGGDAVQLSVCSGGPPALLAFLGSGCDACEPFWAELGQAARRGGLPGGARVAVITHGPERESPSRVAALAGDGLQVVMSQRAFEQFGVTVTPYMVFVDAAGGPVIGEGTAASFTQLLALMADALGDLAAAAGGAAARIGGPGADRALAAVGIGAGHPSLYPSGAPGGAESR
jgi:hypothetical protein